MQELSQYNHSEAYKIHSTPTRNWLLIGFLLVYTLYGLCFIWRTSFLIGDERYFVLLDDAMVSMRYARNLAQGNGLVWNPGERVEGITNPLWALFMSFWHLLPIPASKMSLAIQLSSLVFMLISLYLAWRLAERLIRSRLVVAGVGLLISFYYPLNYWGLTGLEVGLLTCLTTATCWRMIRMLNEGKYDGMPLLLMGVAVLVRLDMMLLLLVTQGILFLLEPRWRWKVARQVMVVLLVVLGLPMLVRHVYFGQWLPNTYFLKMNGYPLIGRIQAGVMAWWNFIRQTNPVLFLLAFIAFRLPPTRRYAALLVAAFVCQTGYSIYVGGDSWEDMGGSNRFLTVVMPLFFILLAWGIHQGVEFIGQKFNQRDVWKRRFWPVLLPAMFLLILIHINHLPLFQCDDYWLLTRPLGFELDHKYMVNRGLWIREHTDPCASIAVVWAGMIPYFSERYAIDLLGKCDPVIARLPMHSRPFWPGHLKWDYEYSVGKRKPDLIVQLWWIPEKSRQPSPDYILLEKIPPDAFPWIQGTYYLISFPSGNYLVNKEFRNLSRLKQGM